MNVLFITPGYPSKSNTVPGIFIKNIAESLKTLGVTVTVIQPVPMIPLPKSFLPEYWKIYKDLPHFERSKTGICIYRPRYFSYPKSTIWGIAHLFIYFSIRNLLKKYKLQPQIVHAHFAYPMGYVAKMLKFSLNIPYVCTIRGDDINVLPLISPFQRTRVMKALCAADQVTSVSKTLAEKAFKLTGIYSRVIYNGVELNEYKDRISKCEARYRNNLDKNRFYVLYVGAITRTKGVCELIEVIKANKEKNVQFIVIGDEINSQENITIPSCCLHLGRQPQKIVFEYMIAADVLVLPSYGEGMPNVVVEAASFGLPIIATSVGGIPEIIGAETGMLIEPRSSDAITNSIAKVREDYPDALRKAERLKDKIRSSYDLHKNSKILKEIYENLLTARSN